MEWRAILHVLVVALAVSVLGFAAPGAQADPPDRVQPGIWRLHGLSPDLPADDLERLRPVLEGASVVGLGESIHTSGGFYTMKHRVFRFLVERMRFRALAMETPWDDARAAAEYVATCAGSPEQASLQGLFPVWASAETAGLLRWMCEWNQAHPQDPVTFFGFDIQQPWDDGPALLAFLRGQGVPEEDPRIAGIRLCEAVEGPRFPLRVTEEELQACTGALAETRALLDSLAAARQLPDEDSAWLRLRVESLRAWEEQVYYQTRNFRRSFEARDRGMAYAFTALRDLLGLKTARTALWAHNDHVARRSTELYTFKTLGTFLGEELGHRYAAVALTAHDAYIHFGPFDCGGPEPAVPGSVDGRLRALGEPYLLVDLDFNGAPEPFLGEEEIAILGYTRWIPRRQFDALIYLDTSPAMTPLAWPAECRL